MHLALVAFLLAIGAAIIVFAPQLDALNQRIIDAFPPQLVHFYRSLPLEGEQDAAARIRTARYLTVVIFAIFIAVALFAVP